MNILGGESCREGREIRGGAGRSLWRGVADCWLRSLGVVPEGLREDFARKFRRDS